MASPTSTAAAIEDVPAPSKRRLGWMLRVVGLIVLVGLFLRNEAAIQAAGTALSRADKGLALAGLAFYLTGIGCTVLRMSHQLQIVGFPTSKATLWADIAKGTALNAVMPSGAGELYRIQCLRTRGVPTLAASSVIVVDRMCGLFVFAVMAAIGVMALGGRWMGWNSKVAVVGVVGGLALCLAAVLIARHEGVRTRIATALPGPRTLLVLIGYSAAMLGFWILSVALLAQSIGIEAEFSAYLYSAPLVAIASLLPISVGGIGVREAGYAALLASYGVSIGESVALGFMQYATYLVLSAGGLSARVWERTRRG